MTIRNKNCPLNKSKCIFGCSFLDGSKFLYKELYKECDIYKGSVAKLVNAAVL